jgi:hypothetical protein
MPMSEALALVLTAGLLLLNGLFVAAEFALVAARRSAIEPLAEAGSRRADPGFITSRSDAQHRAVVHPLTRHCAALRSRRMRNSAIPLWERPAATLV